MTLEEWLAADMALRNSPAEIARVERKIAAMELHAAAQQATAVAMTAMVAAQQATTSALGVPVKPTREQLVLDALLRLPEITGQTDLAMVDLAIKKVDAYLVRFPAAVQS